MTEPGWYFGFLCKECGTGLPVERRDNAAVDTGARPIAIGAWEIRCPAVVSSTTTAEAASR